MWWSYDQIDDYAGLGEGLGDYIWSVDLAADGAGTYYSVWTQDRWMTHDTYYSSAYFAYRPTGSYWWSSSASSVPTDYLSDGPALDAALAVDAGRQVHSLFPLIYWDTLGNASHLVASSVHAPSGDWQPGGLAGYLGSDRANNVDIATNDSGNVYAAWSQAGSGVDYAIYASVKQASGAWGPAEYVGTGPIASAAIAADGAGNAYVAWTANEQVYIRQRLPNGAWCAPVAIGDLPAYSSRAPDIAVDQGGAVYVAWTSTLASQQDIAFSWRDSAGSWHASIRVNDDTGSARQAYPRIATDSLGGIHVVWLDWRSSGDSALAAPDVYYAVATSQ
ncbi:MAG: hypothetical protein ACYC5O_24180 [Anaerolineae bacterium]